jgi:hypothetical protein
MPETRFARAHPVNVLALKAEAALRVCPVTVHELVYQVGSAKFKSEAMS